MVLPEATRPSQSRETCTETVNGPVPKVCPTDRDLSDY
jgi:hypothetical protein